MLLLSIVISSSSSLFILSILVGGGLEGKRGGVILYHIMLLLLLDFLLLEVVYLGLALEKLCLVCVDFLLPCALSSAQLTRLIVGRLRFYCGNPVRAFFGSFYASFGLCLLRFRLLYPCDGAVQTDSLLWYSAYDRAEGSGSEME